MADALLTAREEARNTSNATINDKTPPKRKQKQCVFLEKSSWILFSPTLSDSSPSESESGSELASDSSDSQSVSGSPSVSGDDRRPTRGRTLKSDDDREDRRGARSSKKRRRTRS